MIHQREAFLAVSVIDPVLRRILLALRSFDSAERNLMNGDPIANRRWEHARGIARTPPDSPSPY